MLRQSTVVLQVYVVIRAIEQPQVTAEVQMQYSSDCSWKVHVFVVYQQVYHIEHIQTSFLKTSNTFNWPDSSLGMLGNKQVLNDITLSECWKSAKNQI